MKSEWIDLGKYLESGDFSKKDGSSYQCFRRGNEFCWIGVRFIEIGNRSWQYARIDDDDKVIWMNKESIEKALS